MVNFYEELDKVFDKLIANHENMFNELVEVKSDIITAYEDEKGYKALYYKNMLVPKHFKINEKGEIVSV